MKKHPSLETGIWGGVIGAATMSRVLASIWVEKFPHQADAATKLIECHKISSWDRRSVVEKGGWATPMGLAARGADLSPERS
jgi:hypothetical protein